MATATDRRRAAAWPWCAEVQNVAKHLGSRAIAKTPAVEPRPRARSHPGLRATTNATNRQLKKVLHAHVVLKYQLPCQLRAPPYWSQLYSHGKCSWGSPTRSSPASTRRRRRSSPVTAAALKRAAGTNAGDREGDRDRVAGSCLGKIAARYHRSRSRSRHRYRCRYRYRAGLGAGTVLYYGVVLAVPIVARW